MVHFRSTPLILPANLVDWILLNPQHLKVVQCHRLYNDPDGPTIILFAALNRLLPWLIYGTKWLVALASN